jgi:peptide/nickel transport system permease protein
MNNDHDNNRKKTNSIDEEQILRKEKIDKADADDVGKIDRAYSEQKKHNKINNAKKYIEVLSEFKSHKTGIAGVVILIFLISLTVYAVLFIPFDSFKEWNNPTFWIDNPKIAAPIWSSLGLFGEKSPEHMILSSSPLSPTSPKSSPTTLDKDDQNMATVSETQEHGIKVITHSYKTDYLSTVSPTDFMITYSLSKGEVPPAMDVEVTRPDGTIFEIYFDSIMSTMTGSINNITYGRLFSTDDAIHQKLLNYLNMYNYIQDPKRPQLMLFSELTKNSILKGEYIFNVKFYLFNDEDKILETKLILGGKRFGIIGTDEMRRDLAIGLLWGTPIALFIGLSVSSISILIGLVYGVISGYKGRRTDEGLMRINDIFYSLPTLPLLIILSIIVGRNIFIIVLFLIFFGWMGTAKISRSLALQIKNFQYIEAAKMMGQSDIKIIFKHIIPQLLPLTFASIAISVPGAILAEASLSFIGLGDPSVPTWGQILHEAHLASAASRGLWWWLIPPGMLIALTGLAFVLIGNTFESIFNPKMKKQ